MLDPAATQPSESSELARHALKTTFSLSQFFSDGLSLGISMYTQFNNLPIALVLGLSSGLLSSVTTWGFKGPVIDKYFGAEASDDEHVWLSPVIATATCWFYTTMRLLQEFGMNYFILDSLLAWYSAFVSHAGLQLTAMSPILLLTVMAYTLLVNIPFVLSNEIYETCEQINRQAGIVDERPPIHWLVYPLRHFEAYISTFGSLMHSIEHLINFMLLIPPEWIVLLLQAQSLTLAFGATLALFGFAVLFLVHLVQTYFFEGRHTKMNLIALDRELTDDEETYHIESEFEYHAIWFSNYLLDTQSIFHAADDSRMVLLSLMTLGYPQAAVLLGITQFIIVCCGIQCSSIYEAKCESQKALEQYETKLGS